MNEVKKRKKQKLHMERFLCIVFLLCSGILSAQTYKVGDLYVAPDGSKGIVYYVFPGGTGGWIVALKDASTGCGWGVAEDVQALPNRNSTYVQNLLADTAGYANTLAMRNHPYNNTYYAAAKVNFTNGWVLPSPGQLSVLFGQLPFITTAIINAGGTELATNDYYWSSAEYSATNAWRIYFGTGSFNNGTKSINARVRAVRSFSMTPATNNTEYTYSWSTGDSISDIIVSPSQTTTYSVVVSTPGGYSDTAQQTIVVYATNNTDTSAFSCDSYEWNGQVYTESGEYTISTLGEGGCENVSTLHLTIEKTPQVTIQSPTETTCGGEDVALHAVVSNSVIVGPSQVPNVAVGDILCTDGSVVKFSAWPAQNKTAKGIIFYVDNTGEHGWAVNLHDQASAIQWCFSGVDVIPLNNLDGATAYMDLDGYQNTQIIRAAGNDSMFPAAYIVDFDNGWYLPALGQLRLMFAYVSVLNSSLGIVGGTQFPMNTDFYYWSSTESSYATAWRISNKGFITGYSKDNLNYTPNAVRSVCSF